MNAAGPAVNGKDSAGPCAAQKPCGRAQLRATDYGPGTSGREMAVRFLIHGCEKTIATIRATPK